MAEIAEELEHTIDFKFKSSLETLSKGALYLRMLYNQVGLHLSRPKSPLANETAQCIILATRPLLICLLQDTLGSFSRNTRRSAVIPSSIWDLLQACEEAATKTLKMLVALSNHNLLGNSAGFCR
jgi:hypothetical protein